MLTNCHTYYSFCYGTHSIEGLMEEVKLKGYDRFAVTDINNTSACLDVLRTAKSNHALKPIVGIDFRNGVQQNYVGLAMNNDGFRELNEHLSEHLHKTLPYKERAPEFKNVYIIYPLQKYKGWTLRNNEFIGVSVKDLSSYPFYSLKNYSKIVVMQPVTFNSKKHYNVHRLLRAIDTNSILSKLPITEQASPDEVMPDRMQLYRAFSKFPQAVINTEQILENCNVDFDYGKLKNKNLKHFTGSASGDLELLRKECNEGLKYRYPKMTNEIEERVKKELEVVTEMNFASYFLINWDIVNYARHKGYYYVGRGSGANSILAYLLRITDVDPIDLDLYFERFINSFRTNAPDFDMDFSWKDRDDITDYIFERFNEKGKKNRVALLGAYNTFKSDSMIRELGKVFGMPPSEIDRLKSMPDDVRVLDDMSKMIFGYSKLIHDFPSHLSIHSSGIIISEEPITAYSATNMPPKGYPTTQFSMLEAEDVGLFKFDILSQRGLGKIKDCLEIVKKEHKVEIDIHNVKPFLEDKKIKELLKVGNTIGCFYVESPAMRMLLAKLRADDYLRLVAASSIIRPGVAKSGMMREYIIRFRHQELRDKAKAELPELYELLKETYGVMVYQEDVIKVAHFFAGLTLAEADCLRRGMSWKFKQRNEFFTVEKKFMDNCRDKGYPEKLTKGIWTQIESFANFAFSKGHSASYAVESYQALYLKAYYPLEYMVATLNNGGGFYRIDLYIHEARLHGARIKAPCVNNSEEKCIIKANVIYLSLGMVIQLSTDTVNDILTERRTNGLFKSVADFVKRVPVSIEQMRLLVRVGAFNFTGKNKKEILWEIHMLINPGKKQDKRPELFEIKPKQWQLPALSSTKLDEAFDEIELLGFPLCSPFELLREKLTSNVRARDLSLYKNKTVSIAGYLINVKNTSTSKGDRMYFGTFLDMEGRWIDTVHFPPSAKQFPFTGQGCYLLKGKVVEEYDFVNIEVEEMKHLPVVDRETMTAPITDVPEMLALTHELTTLSTNSELSTTN